MAERTLSEQLDEAVEAMMARPDAPLPRVTPKLAALLRIARDLSDLPSREFKGRLKEDLQRRAEAWIRSQQQAAEPDGGSDYLVEPHLPVRGARRLIEFLEEAFGAQVSACHTRPDGSVAHAEIRIADSVVGVGEASGEAQAAPTAIHLYVPDADTVYERALRAGATSIQEPADQPYGDREAGVRDPFGNHWYIGTHRAEAAYIPEGLKAITSYLHPRGAPQLIDFLKQAFAAQEVFRAQAPDGMVVHAKIRIGQSIIEMGEAHGPYQPMPTVYHLYVAETDAVYYRAVEAGGISLSQPADQPWGFRNAGVQDPCGNQWWINTPIAGAPPEGVHRDQAPKAEEPASGTVTPFLLVGDVGGTIDFLKEAFGAEVILFDRGGDPPHDHAELRVGDSLLMMGESIPGYAPTTSAFYLRVADVDAAYERALRAGASSQQAPKEMPWGHRMAHIRDPIGNSWFIAAKGKQEGT